MYSENALCLYEACWKICCSWGYTSPRAEVVTGYVVCGTAHLWWCWKAYNSDPHVCEKGWKGKKDLDYAGKTLPVKLLIKRVSELVLSLYLGISERVMANWRIRSVILFYTFGGSQISSINLNYNSIIWRYKKVLTKPKLVLLLFCFTIRSREVDTPTIYTSGEIWNEYISAC